MKNVLKTVSAAFIGLLVGFIFIQLTSVPEVYADSSEISYNDGGQLPLWAVKQIKDKDGKLVPQENWKQVLEGRYQLVLVSPEWQPKNSEKIQ